MKVHKKIRPDKEKVKKVGSNNRKKVISKQKVKEQSKVVIGGKARKSLRRKQHNEENIRKAIDAYQGSDVSLRKIAAAFDVPVSTLARRKYKPEVQRRGPTTILSEQEEKDIVDWILYRAERGYPVTKTELFDCVQKYIEKLNRKTSFANNRPGRHWYAAFRKRHPNLSLRKVQHLSLTIASVTEHDIKEWFHEQKNYLKNKDLLHISAERIFNCDETSIQLCPDSERAFIEKGSRSAYKITDAGKESITVLFTYSAAGTRAPPILMFPYKGKLPKKIIENTAKDWGLGVSDNGWMTTESFYEYFTNVFYFWLIAEGVEFPVIMYLDNHSSHVSPPIVKFCREKNIEIIGLYPNATHIYQSLDIGFFHPFKEKWKNCVPKWKNEKSVARVTKENFPLVLKYTLDQMDEKETVKNAFRASGLMPFDFNNVDCSVLKKGKKIRTISSPNEQNQENSNFEKSKLDEKHFLDYFETTLPVGLLEEFKAVYASGFWTGDVEKKALFEYWTQMRDNLFGETCDTNLKGKPIMKSYEKVNFNLKMVRQENAIDSTSGDSNSVIHEQNNIPAVHTNNKSVSEAPNNVSAVYSSNESVVEEASDHRTDVLDKLIPYLTSDDTNKVHDESIIEILPLDLANLYLVDATQSFLLNSTEADLILPNNVSESTNSSLSNTASSTDTTINSLEIESEINGPIVHNTRTEITNKENINTNTIAGQSANEVFSEVFTLPTKYLPKTKRIKVEASGKPKLPSAACSDEWWQHQMRKEEEQQKKEETKMRKKQLQQEKKQLQEKVKLIKKKIKEEK